MPCLITQQLSHSPQLPHVFISMYVTPPGMQMLHGKQLILPFVQVWRWAFFFSGFVPIFWISRLAVHLLVIVVEYAWFSSKPMYYLYGIRVRSTGSRHVPTCSGMLRVRLPAAQYSAPCKAATHLPQTTAATEALMPQRNCMLAHCLLPFSFPFSRPHPCTLHPFIADLVLCVCAEEHIAPAACAADGAPLCGLLCLTRLQHQPDCAPGEIWGRKSQL